ncbi:molybdate ABC transporter substrate-binding protein [Kitasatospora sp. NPDC057015]|uniref:molybdate ABC transporter substrate-binding protein n=1 Tax=Kitasatospora sp. NPDC057015 TaxID=3346001 RepID=UPI00362ACA47
MVKSRAVRRRALGLAGCCTAVLLALSGCSSDSSSGSAGAGSTGSASSGASTSSASSASSTVSGTVTVFAAASLKEAFTTLGGRFEAAHPGTKVVFNFAGSDALAASIVAGAPADVFAAASPTTMKTVTDQGDAGTPTTFVRNQLEIATVPGNPHHIASLQDLAQPGLKVVLCAKEVPCGAAAQKALAAGNVQLTPVSYEQDVKAALTKVELQEADASLVYQTDVKSAAGKVDGVPFPEAASAINDYPIATLTHAPNSAGAQAFVALVESPDGQKVLTDAGFLSA